ncbi:hypothetical protein [Actinomyces minihominis]|uniref:hypothetical protein n=1 Tax=Actinomyces minihominis TaxID=2002838 RepID=UPI00101AE5F0|nr:hypothetical protein [Actinomyces minihominis]
MPPQPRKQRTLSNTVTYSAVGAMLLIAAIGFLIMWNTYGSFQGNVILVATGLIILIGGAVIVYAAATRQRPGWFLPFTIVGAVISGPILLGGYSISALSYYDTGYTSEVTYEESYELEEMPTTYLDYTEEEIWSSGENNILDLRQVPEGVDFDYDVELYNAELTVLLTSEQMPVIEGMEVYDSTFFEALTSDLSGGELGEIDAKLEYWASFGMSEGDYPWDFGRRSQDARNVFGFDVFASGYSAIRFVIDVKDDPTASVDSSQSGAKDDSQQSTGKDETPQSADTSKDGKN